MKEEEGKLSELMRDPVVSGKLNVHKNDIFNFQEYHLSRYDTELFLQACIFFVRFRYQ